VTELLRQAVPVSALVVAVDPGKASNRVWLTSGERGLIGEPVSLPVLREGIDTLTRLIGASGVAGPPVIGVEATGGLHRAWVAELERGQAVLACAAAFAGQAPTVRSLRARAPGRLTQATARFWVDRWRRLLPPLTPTCARSGWAVTLPATKALQADIAAVEAQITRLLAATDGRSSPACPGSRWYGRPASPPTASPSPGTRPPSSCTRPPGWRQPPTSRPA